MDLLLPDLAGLEIIDRLAAAVPKIPIIALCSLADELVAKEPIQRGAQDYLLKEHFNNYLLPKTLAAVIERASITVALFDEKERAQVTLNSIGDAVISTDVDGCISYLNLVAERLTGWPLEDASEGIHRERRPGLRADRERALLCVAYETLARRGELVALKIWLEHASIREGAIFRRLIGRDKIGESLHPGSIAPIFKRVAQWIGMPARFVAEVSGHSTRVGAMEIDADAAAVC